MNGAAVRPRWPAGVGVAVVLAALAFALALGGWTWRADRLVYDIGLSFWRRPVPEGIVIVAIDDASVAAIGRWPWPRAVHSTLLARLAAARPRAIGLDVWGVGDDSVRSNQEMWSYGTLRELGANLKMMWDLVSRRRPVLGPHDDSLDRALQS